MVTVVGSNVIVILIQKLLFSPVKENRLLFIATEYLVYFLIQFLSSSTSIIRCQCLCIVTLFIGIATVKFCLTFSLTKIVTCVYLISYLQFVSKESIPGSDQFTFGGAHLPPSTVYYDERAPTVRSQWNDIQLVSNNITTRA